MISGGPLGARNVVNEIAIANNNTLAGNVTNFMSDQAGNVEGLTRSHTDLVQNVQEFIIGFNPGEYVKEEDFLFSDEIEDKDAKRMFDVPLRTLTTSFTEIFKQALTGLCKAIINLSVKLLLRLIKLLAGQKWLIRVWVKQWNLLSTLWVLGCAQFNIYLICHK